MHALSERLGETNQTRQKKQSLDNAHATTLADQSRENLLDLAPEVHGIYARPGDSNEFS